MIENESWNVPKVWVWVIISYKCCVLLWKRKSKHWSWNWWFPGWHLEYGEDILSCAYREVREETWLILNVSFLWPYTNDIMWSENKHYVTLFVIGDYIEGQVIQNLEPNKCESWEWFKRDQLPKDLFLPIENLLKTWFTPF